MTSYLLGRIIDPVLGVATGFFAFWLNEHHDGTAPPPGYSLSELLEWKYPRAERRNVLPSLPKRDSSEEEGIKIDQGLAEMLREAGWEESAAK